MPIQSRQQKHWKKCEIYLMLTIKIAERRQWLNPEHISYLFLLFLCWLCCDGSKKYWTSSQTSLRVLSKSWIVNKVWERSTAACLFYSKKPMIWYWCHFPNVFRKTIGNMLEINGIRFQSAFIWWAFMMQYLSMSINPFMTEASVMKGLNASMWKITK